MTETYYIIGSNEDTISFDNLQYSINRESLEGLSGFPVEYDTTAPPGYIGEVINSTTIIPRTISFIATVWGAGRAQLEARRQRLIEALNPILGVSKFCWKMEDGKTYVLDVVPEEESPSFTIGTGPTDTRWDCVITLIAHDPTWKLSTSTKVPIMSTGGFTLPFSIPFQIGNQRPQFPLVNRGTAPTPVIIEVQGRLDSPISFTNQTTGETITIRKTIYENEKLIIDTSDDNLRVIFIDSQGNESDALHFCSVGSKFWQLAPGTNIMTYQVARRYDSSKGSVTFTQRWVSR